MLLDSNSNASSPSCSKHNIPLAPYATLRITMPKDRHLAASRGPTIQKDSNTTHIPRTPPSSTLPPQLRSSVPHCAQLCLANYINQEYNCPYYDFTCLCREYSSQGFSLGELAYICLEQECGHASTAESKSAYFVCAAKSGAVQPTHRTLTLPATTASLLVSSTTLDTAPTGSKPKPHHSKTFRTSKASHTTPTATTDSAMSAAMGHSSSQSSSSSSTAAATGKAASHSLPATHLTAAQAAGISIAAMGAVMLAIAAVYLIACFKRRKVTQEDDRKSYDFVDEAPPRFSPFNYGYADPRGPLGGFHDRRVELTAEKRTSNWYRSRFGDPQTQRYEKNVDISPQSHRSNESMRTVSQLLPDKPDPTYSRPAPKSPAPSAFTATTVFEEDRVPPVPRVKPLPKLPPPGRAVYYPPPSKPSKPSRPPRPEYTDQFTQSPDRARQPSLSLDIPKQAARLSRIPSPVAFPLPPNVHRLDIDQPPSRGSKSDARESAGSVLNYYASPQAGCDSSPDLNSATPIEAEVQRRKPVPNAITVTKPTYPPRAVRMNSNGSDTSFESNESNEPTPPEEVDRQLTPVELTPVAESPIAGIRYPKVPRSSNQSVPRSPATKSSPFQAKRPQLSSKDDRTFLPSQHEQKDWKWQDPVTPKRQGTTSSTLSGSTLAAKRLGSSAAQDLERRLHLADSTHSRTNSRSTTQAQKSEPNSGKSRRSERNNGHDSPLKGYGRVASGGRRVSRGHIGPEMRSPGPHLWKSPGLPGQPQEISLRSPLWEPKLTPSRRGDDLYLSVGVASPMTAGFTPLTDTFSR